MAEFIPGVGGVSYRDLHESEGLRRLFEIFKKDLGDADAALSARYSDYLAGSPVEPLEESRLLIALAPYVSRFVARIFNVEEDWERMMSEELAFSPVFAFKKEFVQRRVLKKFTADEAVSFDEPALRGTIVALLGIAGTDIGEEHVAALASRLLAEEKSGGAAEVLADLEKWTAALYHRRLAPDWVSFRIPHKVDHTRLVAVTRPDAALPEKIEGPQGRLRRRDGFELTDGRMGLKAALGEVDYCIYCHERDKDSCSKGLRENRTKTILSNPLGIELGGCPLDEKISEAHVLRKEGDFLAALAMIVVDNPMCPGTGHRICNDCMKSCIFQKQDPVNVPEVETDVLTRVLDLPYGFEIYAFLTRFNPLNRKRPYALPYNGKNVLVAGMGPAGYTLAHYLLNEGFGVVGIDGLKIEPLPESLSGKGFQPIRDFKILKENLSERTLAGFGGVAEYGITVRWDKNFLKVIYLTLARRPKFRVYGGVRFGGTASTEDAWDLGFDHVAMATGAGRPTVVDMKNNLIRGVRKASDFLMALQLTGAFKKRGLANLQVRLPAIVVGGGLTAIDTATEILAYYPHQVEKILERYEVLLDERGEAAMTARFSEEDREILDEFLAHGRAVRAERARAARSGESPDFVRLVRSWGGVSIAYRKGLADCPAYRLNHEEVVKALEEGISFIENVSPVEALRDRFGALNAVKLCRRKSGVDGTPAEDEITVPARALLVAAGTSPNVVYEKERPGTFSLDGKKRFFRKHACEDGAVAASESADAFFTSYDRDGRRVSFYGDNHPDFAGNVVKAMASARRGYPRVVGLFEHELAALKPSGQAGREARFADFARRLDEEWKATVHAVNRLTPTIVEVVVKVPSAARNFKPGQFYRLQNYEAHAPRVDGTPLAMEGLALTGAWTDAQNGLLGLIVLEMGGSSRLCASLKFGEPVVVMGPTGAPTEIPEGETVVLLGGGLGNAVLFSIGQAMKAAGNRVLYFAGYKDGADVFKREEIEKGTDTVVWSNDVGSAIKPTRSQDKSFTGNIVQAMIAYAEGRLGPAVIALSEGDRIIAIGSDRMMNAVREARHGVLAPYLKKNHVAVGSINSPMQCMMKEVCAQCLCKHVDPETGAEARPVFSCFNQDQLLDAVDFKNLNERLQANRLQEILSNLWLDRLLERGRVERI
jgi:NADPH-dependent glutamate synthase beta subunit-like oxidoreductase/NAD(P)H-flavin reductase